MRAGAEAWCNILALFIQFFVKFSLRAISLFSCTHNIMTTPFEKPQIISHIQKSLNYTVFDSKWIPCSAKFVCLGNFARGTGVMQIYEVQHGEVQLVKEV